MKKIRVLIVDDSLLVRSLIRSIIEMDPDIEVAGEASNGLEAVEQARSLHPDVITMDIEMPVMDGLRAIGHIMADNAVPILVVTSRGDAKTAYTAIANGALEIVMKPDLNVGSALEFTEKLKLVSKVSVISHISGRLSQRHPVVPDIPLFGSDVSDRIVAIASSTGGPGALSVILSHLPEKFPLPIVIAQHISDGFVSGMIGWLKTLSHIELKMAEHGEFLRPGIAYFCPSENHMKIDFSKKVVFEERRSTDIYRPSCDILLSSVADSFGKKAIGVILTGMGNDGVAGITKIRKAGGWTIAQDENTSIIFGMPRLAIDNGGIDIVLPLEAIGGEIVRAAAGTAAAWTGQCS